MSQDSIAGSGATNFNWSQAQVYVFQSYSMLKVHVDNVEVHCVNLKCINWSFAFSSGYIMNP